MMSTAIFHLTSLLFCYGISLSFISKCSYIAPHRALKFLTPYKMCSRSIY